MITIIVSLDIFRSKTIRFLLCANPVFRWLNHNFFLISVINKQLVNQILLESSNGEFKWEKIDIRRETSTGASLKQYFKGFDQKKVQAFLVFSSFSCEWEECSFF